MRFVAGRGAVAESHRESAAGRGAVAESHRESVAGRGAAAERLQRGGAMAELLLARAQQRSCIGKPTNAHKREGPGRDLNISPEPVLFIALRKGYTPCDEAEPPFTAGIRRRHAVQAKLPPACNAGAVAAAIMQGLQGRLQQMQELRRALGIRQG